MRRLLPGAVVLSVLLFGASAAGAAVTALSASDARTCALSDGAVVCWGYPIYDRENGWVDCELDPEIPPEEQPPLPEWCNRKVLSPTPSTVDSAGEAIAVATSDHQTCAIRSTGAVVCWGDMFGAAIADSMPPDAVNGTSGTATALAMFARHACAIRATSNALVCWGDDRFTARWTVPASLNGTSGTATAVATGGYHTCAVQASSGSVLCFPASPGAGTTSTLNHGQTTVPGGL